MNRHSFLIDRAHGTFLGLAVGDRIGGPTQMALLLAESLADNQAFDAEDIRERYLEWWRSGGFDTGQVAQCVFQKISQGEPWDKAVEQTHRELGGMTAGCNPAHRAAPLSLAAFIELDNLASVAMHEAAQTHHDPLAGDVSAAVVVLCRHLIDGVDWKEAIELAMQGRSAITASALRPALRSSLNTGGYAPDVLQAAMFFLQSHQDFHSALNDAIDFAGGANYCPVLVGAIGGARWGRIKIDVQRIVNKETSLRIESAVKRLLREEG